MSKGYATAIIMAIFIAAAAIAGFVIMDNKMNREKEIIMKEQEIILSDVNFHLADQSLKEGYYLTTVQIIYDLCSNGFGNTFWYNGTKNIPSLGEIESKIEESIKNNAYQGEFIMNGVKIRVDKLSANVNITDRLTYNISSVISVLKPSTDGPTTKSGRRDYYGLINVDIPDMIAKGECVIDALSSGLAPNCGSGITIEDGTEKTIKIKSASQNYFYDGEKFIQKPFELVIKFKE